MKLLKLFSFFRKKKKEEPVEDSEFQSSVTYSIDHKGEMFIDVTLSSFEDKVIENFAELICTISSMKCHLTTLQMIKDNFQNEDQLQQLDKFVTLVLANQATVNKYEQNLTRKDMEEPCIKPSDML